MADFQEEVYIIEKQEITDDEGDDQDYDSPDIDEDPELADLGDLSDDDEDLNDFEALKTKMDIKQLKKAKETGVSGYASALTNKEKKPVSIERPVVIDDFIRNFLTKSKMNKTMNTFQQEWFDLQKKGTFQDVGLGLVTDINNKNIKMQAKIEKMRSELASAKVVADDAKSTWEKLRKERDYHKAHQNRVNDEKITITANIKKVVAIQGETEEKIVDVKKKLLNV